MSNLSTGETPLTWPASKQVYLTLDFECDYGTAIRSNHYNAVDQSDRLIEILEDHEVPLSCFLQTEILKVRPESLDPLVDAEVEVEFHAHSHTHPSRDSADPLFEISESIKRVRNEFDTEPLGFRFPDGAASAEDYQLLSENSIDFSSSVFPSWRPGRFNNLRASRQPSEMSGTGVMELPFTVYSDLLRIPVSLSYLKLLGSPFEKLVSLAPPTTIVFDFHMHDLVVPPTFGELSVPYRYVYARRRQEGPDILDRFIGRLKEQGYAFGLMGNLYEEVLDGHE